MSLDEKYHWSMFEKAFCLVKLPGGHREFALTPTDVSAPTKSARHMELVVGCLLKSIALMESSTWTQQRNRYLNKSWPKSEKRESSMECPLRMRAIAMRSDHNRSGEAQTSLLKKSGHWTLDRLLWPFSTFMLFLGKKSLSPSRS